MTTTYKAVEPHVIEDLALFVLAAKEHKHLFDWLILPRADPTAA